MKKIIGWLLSIILVLSAAGCGTDAAPETTAPAQTAPPEVPFETRQDERKYQGIQLEYCTMLAGEEPRAAVILQAVEVFEKQTGAEVAITWLGGDEQELMQRLAEGEAVDVFEVSGQSLGQSCLDYALDLTEMARSAGYETRSYPCLRQQVMDRCGYLAGIPYVPYLWGVYYNRDAFEECGISVVPDSWEDFLAVCGKLRAGGFEPLALDAENAGTALELHLERSFGAEHFAELTADGSWKADEAAALAAQRILEFTASGFLAGGTLSAYPAGQNQLALSNGAMTVGPNTLCGQVEQAALAALSWGVFPWPGDGMGSGTAVDSDVLAVCKASANAQAAFDFIMLLATGEFDQLRTDVIGGIPTDPGNQSSIAGVESAMIAAAPRSLGLLDSGGHEVALKLWQGKYKTDKDFAAAMDALE